MSVRFHKGWVLSTAAALVLSTGVSWASGFALQEESVSNMSNDYAGAAASGKDASNEFYNPAQATLFKKSQLSIGAVIIPVRTKFDGQWIASGSPQANGNLNSKVSPVVPDLHYIKPIGKKYRFTFGITAPFGLSTDYDASKWQKSSSGETTAGAPTKTAVQVVNINPGIAMRLSSKWSVAAGVDAGYGKAEYNAQMGTASFNNSLDGWGVGYNLGLLYEFNKATRVGLSYRSGMTLDASGPSTLATSKKSANSSFKLPGQFILGSYHHLQGSRWSLVDELSYTQWSTIQHLVIKKTAIGTDVDAYLHYKDTWFVSAGANYQLNKRWTLSGGVGYDQTPTRDGYRDLRLPDADRTVVALGAQYQYSNSTKLDFGYQHIFSGKSHVNSSKRHDSSIGYAVGDATVDANLFGVAVDMHW
jgi:long-chain fatty acid transport protein